MLKNSFAIVLPWPHVNSAEKEAIERAKELPPTEIST